MSTSQLIQNIKARMNHEVQKKVLEHKYTSKLIFAHNGGCWKASTALISFLVSMQDQETVIVLDEFNNPIRVNVTSLLQITKDTYVNVMNEWRVELDKLERMR
jgi:hypothetical protein